MDLRNLNRQAITFCAIAILFLGSLYYFIATAFLDGQTIAGRQAASQDYLKTL